MQRPDVANAKSNLIRLRFKKAIYLGCAIGEKWLRRKWLMA